MKKAVFLLLFILSCKSIIKAQIFIEPLAGFELDVRNHQKFKRINTALQVSFAKRKRSEFLIQLRRASPVTATSGDSSFSANPALPVYADAKKTIRPAAFSVSLGHRIALTHTKAKGKLWVVVYSGVTFDDFKVSYNYDKVNYTILNPDKSLHTSGVFLSAGIEYAKRVKSGRLFTQLTISTPPSSYKIRYPSSFNYMAPLAINAGYSFSIVKKKNVQ